MRYYYVFYLFAAIFCGCLVGTKGLSGWYGLHCVPLSVLLVQRQIRGKKSAGREVLFFAALLPAVSLLFQLYSQPQQFPPVGQFGYRILRLQGRVLFDIRSRKNSGGTVIVKCSRVQLLDRSWTNVSGRAAFYSRKRLTKGAAVTVCSEVVPVEHLENPRSRDWLQRSKVAVRAVKIESIDVKPLHGVAGLRNAAVAAVEKKLQSLPRSTGGLVLALLTGERHLLPRSLKRAFRRSGLIHLLAVSGLHVALIAGALLWLLQRCGAGRIGSFVGAALFLPLYVLFTGGRPSVIRAAVMFLSYIWLLQQRQTRLPWHALSCAGIAVLLLDPATVSSAGFHLSFAAVAGILLFYPRFQKILAGTRLPVRFQNGLAVSLAAQLAVFPLLLAHFGQASLAAVLLTMPAMPAVILLLAGGWLLLPVTLATGWPWLLQLLRIPGEVLIQLVQFAGSLPLTVKTGEDGFPAAAVVLYYLCIVLIVYWRKLFERIAQNSGVAFAAPVAKIFKRKQPVRTQGVGAELPDQ